MTFLYILAWSVLCGVIYLVAISAIEGIKYRLRLRRERVAAERAEIVRLHGARMLPENRHIP